MELLFWNKQKVHTNMETDVFRILDTAGKKLQVVKRTELFHTDFLFVNPKLV